LPSTSTSTPLINISDSFSMPFDALQSSAVSGINPFALPITSRIACVGTTTNTKSAPASA